MAKMFPKTITEDLPEVTLEPGAFLESVSPSMRPVEAIIGELAQSDVPVLLLAERGAGKHATARRIHDLSSRSTQPFLRLQCAAVKAQDLNFAGDRDEAGGGGTVFLEELAELPSSCQVRLRDALLESSSNGNSKKGNSNPHSTRLIFASAHDLDVEVKAGRLREDLYYRISGVCLRLPPLRQRKEDIPLLIRRFLEYYASEYHRPVPTVSCETQRLFREYAWPGNLHELQNAARVLVALGDEHLAMGGLRALLNKSAAGNGTTVSLKAASKAASHEAEKELILNVLTRTRWNRRRAAKELQISYKALLYKLKQIGCEGYGAS
jgi:two-component system, NtrC family, response regulator AtoC